MDTINREKMVIQARREILGLLKELKRPGTNSVLLYLETSNFFSASCQTHHQFCGGLAVHVLGVYHELQRLNVPFAESTIRLVGLLYCLYMTRHNRFDDVEPGETVVRTAALLKKLRLKLNAGERYAMLLCYQTPEIPEKFFNDSRHLLHHYLHRSICRDIDHCPGDFSSYNPEMSLATQFDDLLYATHRPGIENVIDNLHREWISSAGERFSFYTVPASTNKHHCWRGGLLQHSLETCKTALSRFRRMVKAMPVCALTEESIVLCSLLHDICKYDEYEISNGLSCHAANWVKGGPHGLKSLMLLDKWRFSLSDEEKKAIAWHMGNFATDAAKAYGMIYRNAAQLSPLVKLIHEADVYSARFPNSRLRRMLDRSQ